MILQNLQQFGHLHQLILELKFCPWSITQYLKTSPFHTNTCISNFGGFIFNYKVTEFRQIRSDNGNQRQISRRFVPDAWHGRTGARYVASI